MKTNLQHLARILKLPSLCCAAAAALMLPAAGWGTLLCLAADVSEAATNEGVEVLTRGPVHEGFAGTVSFKPSTGVTVRKTPPAAIEELPPDQRPNGDNVTWIPGYWAWDDEGDEFLWVSGIWRNLPPGRQWIPGYWSELGRESQWVSGYWADAEAEEVQYLSRPPASIEAGPNIAAPSRGHSWIPGCWIWYHSSYRWRPGYWEAPQPGWVWVPSYYSRAPRGYIYVDGYWDYAIARRGTVFAPVRFSGNYYSRPGYQYQPLIVIGLNVFVEHLFLRPRYSHYYFGDYYATEYRNSGYYASRDYNSGGYGYDPIYAYSRYEHRDDDRWDSRMQDNFAFYRDHEDQRPPHTLTAFNQFTARPDTMRRVDAGFVTPITALAVSKDTPVKFTPVTADDRQKYVLHGHEIRDFSDQQRKLNVKTDAAPPPAQPGKGEPAPEPVRVKIPRSPIVAKTVEQPTADNTPPTRREFVAPDDKTPQPKSGRRPGGRPIPDTAPPIEPVAKDKPKSEPQPTPAGEPKPVEPKTEPKAEPKMDPRHRSRPVPAVEPKVQPGVAPPVEPKTEPKAEPKMNPRRQPRGVPAVEPKVQPNVAPPAEPNVQPKPQPSVEPRSRLRPTPKADPSAEPNVNPRVAPTPQPRLEPPPTPKVEPLPAPKVQPVPPAKPVAPAPTPVTEDPDTKGKDKRHRP